MGPSKALYVGTYVVGIPASAALNIYGMSRRNSGDDMGLILVVVAYLLMSVVIGLWFHLYYRAWKAIQDGHARTTPGKAVGFLLIPLFNLYWVFQAVPGLAKDYNSFIERHGIDARPLPVGLFMAYAISIVIWLVPAVNLLAAWVTVILNIPIMWKMCDAVNALSSSPSATIDYPE